MEKPLISVIVPIYNIENYLEACVQSILCQTYDKMEVLLVDDGSTDGSAEICDRFAESDRRVHAYHKANGGQSEARNYGLDRAKGELIGFIDGDDLIHPQMYEMLCEAIQSADADMATCGFIYGSQPPERQFAFRELHTRLLTRDDAIRDINVPEISPVNKLYRRKLFEGVRYPVGRIIEDEAIIHMLIWKCRRIVVIAEAFYCYIIRAGSTMTSVNPKRIHDALQALEERVAFANEHNWEAAFPEVVERYCRYCIEYYYKAKNGEGGLNSDHMELLWSREREMLDKYAGISVNVRYREFAKNPAKYERRVQREKRIAGIKYRVKDIIKRVIHYQGKHEREDN